MKLYLKILFIFISITISYSQQTYDIYGYGQENPARWEFEEKLKKDLHIKSIKQIKIIYDSAGTIKDTVNKQLEKYDISGNKIYVEYFRENDGTSYGYLEYKYDSLGNEIEMSDYGWDKGEYYFEDKWITHYNNFNKIYLRQYYDKDNKYSGNMAIVYDTITGKELNINICYFDRPYSEIRTYFYDSKGNYLYLIEYISKWSDNKNKMITKIDTLFLGKVKNKIDDPSVKIKYNTRGNIVEWTDKKVLGNKVYKFEFVYDSNENLIEKRNYKGSQLNYQIIYDYQSNGLINSERIYSRYYNYKTYYIYEYY